MNHVSAVHENKKDYRCAYCTKAFNFKGEMKRHVMSVHEKVKHPCDFCNKMYAWKSDLIKHIIKEHKNNKTS